jgi:hypothetical protein
MLMGVDIRLISLQDFLRTNMVGAVDFETSRSALVETVKSAAECGVHHILLDARKAIAVRISAADVFTLVMHLLSLGVDPSYRIAILNDPKDDIDRGKLFEESARERGIDAAAFRDYETALAWLSRTSL